ncbi:hypothetical protein SAY86_019109 [Trapa natans]|uniref:Glycoside hydrolase family 38 N-terminal domain-containing protein n=1 Tax=Trapa natans TaxID=22666 RepID=A0AAN7R2D5_TRANT|nr:hypothetical protein SAY86_019109 [Trapa natans]
MGRRKKGWMALADEGSLLCVIVLWGTMLLGCRGVNGGGYMKYNTGGGAVEGKLNVHLVPHSHDDVGWLKTIDQYYVGSNNSIQGACVENTIDSIVEALLRDPNRKFIYAEMVCFFFPCHIITELFSALHWPGALLAFFLCTFYLLIEFELWRFSYWTLLSYF